MMQLCKGHLPEGRYLMRATWHYSHCGGRGTVNPRALSAHEQALYARLAHSCSPVPRAFCLV